jgi:hypothetical protein
MLIANPLTVSCFSAPVPVCCPQAHQLARAALADQLQAQQQGQQQQQRWRQAQVQPGSQQQA